MRSHRAWVRALTAAAAIGLVAVSSSTVLNSGQTAAARPLAAAGPIPYFVADGTGKAGYQSGDRELAAWALGAWQRSAGQALRFEPAPEERAVLRVYWADPVEGLYGEMRPLAVDGRRGAALYIRPDMAALGADIARHAGGDPLLRDSIVYLTCLHELGHALGLSHTDRFAEIMYSFQFGGDIVEYFSRYRRQLRSRADIASVSGLAPSDVEHLRALYPGP